MANRNGAWRIHGGTIVDGTGAPGYAADVRIRDGRIAEIAPALAPAADERAFDAAGCVVAPGFIESHTHFDGAMWWQPGLDPLPGYGVTTTILGNCGFSLAPLSGDPAVRDEIVGIFSFFEDIPKPPFFEHLPWDWRTWPEYAASAARNVRSPASWGAFCGHIALRLTVMGMDAWRRAATRDEIARMAALLDEALAAGALGLSSNLFDHDGDDRPVPSLRADDAELRALFEVLARHPGTTFQVIIDLFRSMTCVESMERIAKLAEGLDIRVQWGGIPTLEFQKQRGLQAPLVALHERFAREGRDFWTAFAHVPPTVTISVEKSLIFAQSNEYVWHEVVEAPDVAAKTALLRDPAWRARARHSWDTQCFDFGPFREPQVRGLWLQNSANDVGPIGISLGEFADQQGLHYSDAMADWMLANGLESTVGLPPFEKDEAMVVRLLEDPMTVGNVSDAGAHGQMLCGAGENALLFTRFVRDQRSISLEQAVHVQTGKLAKHFSLRDRGELAPGMRADVTVFAPGEIERRPMRKAWDVPDGKGGTTWRWTRDAAPVRLTLANGVATFEGGAQTDALPGEPVERR